MLQVKCKRYWPEKTDATETIGSKFEITVTCLVHSSCPGPAPSLQYGTSPGPLQCWGGEDGDVHPSRPGHSADEEGGDSECVQQPAECEEPENEDGPNTSECVRERRKGDLPAPM